MKRLADVPFMANFDPHSQRFDFKGIAGLVIGIALAITS
jgi:hypothetical protein